MDQIEDLILSSANIPFTPWVMVNADRLVVLMDALREKMPEEIQAAREVTEEQDALIEQARQQAISLVREAEMTREQILSESALMEAIRDEANRARTQLIHELENLKQETIAECEALQREALEEAEAIRGSARQYSADLLKEVEAQLGEMHHRIRLDMQQLNEVRATEQAQLQAGKNNYRKRSTTKRQPRPKVASQQLPIMSSHTSAEDQVEMAMRLLEQQNQQR